jgi:hypothetical protein
MTRGFSSLFAAAAICASATAVQTIPADSPLVQYMGRVHKPGDGTVHFDWLGVGARINWNGNVLSATYRLGDGASQVKLTSWMYAEGYYIQEPGPWVSPAAADANGTVTVVVAVRGGADSLVSLNSPPQYFTSMNSPGKDVALVSFTTDGSFSEPLAPFKRRMEFIGDSITAATNIHAPAPWVYSSCGDGGLQCDYSASWSGILCSSFAANCSTIAVGGKGLIRNCCNSGPPMMPDYYRQTLYSGTEDYTFGQTSFVPDAVVIALGTNDYSGVTPSPSFDAQFTAGYVSFMQNITSSYQASSPAGSVNITFFCAVGPMTDLYMNSTLAAIAEANSQGMRAVLLNVTSAPCDGCAGHPGVVGHRAMATLAAPVIAQVMGW